MISYLLSKIDDPHAMAWGMSVIVIGGTCLTLVLLLMGYGARP